MFRYICCFRIFLLACTLVCAVRTARGQTVTPDLYITEEDLLEAFERGDLSFEEYEQLLELFRSRAASDEQLLDAARIPGDSSPEAQRLAPERTGRAPLAFYQATVPLRGSANENQILGVEPRRGNQLLRWELARGSNDWYVRTARATLVYHTSQLTIGAFDTRWTGGLLIGASPVFLKAPGDFAATISQPKRGRLSGAQYEWRSEHKTVIALASERHDTALVHQSYGIKVADQFRGVAVEACYLHQALLRRRSSKRFDANLIGLATNSQRRDLHANAGLATNTRDVAFQTSVGSRRQSSYDWRLSAWQVPRGFRHPLLAAIGEPDRETIWYPELDLSISSPSTGERGVESKVTFGPRGRANSIAFTYWRENPDAPASLRGKLTRQQQWQKWAMNGEYYMHTRGRESERSFRHELSTRIARGAVYLMTKYRFVEGEWSPFGAHGLRAQTGWRMIRQGEGVGNLAVSLAYDDFDLSRDHSAFWTLRLDQELPLSGRGNVGVHIRWRTGYTQIPPSLTLRVVTTMTL